MADQIDIVCDVSRRLRKLGIAHMLTGSVAMGYYGEPRMTRDIDFVLDARIAHVGPIATEFGGDYYVDEGAVGEAVRARSVFNMIHQRSVTKVDCVIRKDSEYRRVEFERRRPAEVRGVSTHIVSKEDLILSKLVWAKPSHSEMQLRDVANLMSTGYDTGYVDEWKDRLGVGDLLEELGRAGNE
jgi:hypothetical protein